MKCKQIAGSKINSIKLYSNLLFAITYNTYRYGSKVFLVSYVMWLRNENIYFTLF